ncbi:hypothetical protein MmTuc01_0230 [Methanosarcina mazei Tuc01]|uniref:Uncharacterized protein n=1 Tax=Methanosarcina mazei Tuc01 TaxID=1236903 RepID=M1QF98_METMZ|nr:hypothetical protein MmTuc01_0230 [Methanosarcina mazei Tuc01]
MENNTIYSACIRQLIFLVDDLSGSDLLAPLNLPVLKISDYGFCLISAVCGQYLLRTPGNGLKETSG